MWVDSAGKSRERHSSGATFLRRDNWVLMRQLRFMAHSRQAQAVAVLQHMRPIYVRLELVFPCPF